MEPLKKMNGRRFLTETGHKAKVVVGVNGLVVLEIEDDSADRIKSHTGKSCLCYLPLIENGSWTPA